MTSKASNANTASGGKQSQSADKENMDEKKTNNSSKRPNPKKEKSRTKKRCGLCGAKKNLTQTPCCNNWICDDASNYVLFSFSNNSCYRNHTRYTLCGSHWSQGHDGSWQECQECRKGCSGEMIAWSGTNEFNFEKMVDPPSFDPTLCSGCGRVIQLSQEACVITGGSYRCLRCPLKASRTETTQAAH